MRIFSLQALLVLTAAVFCPDSHADDPAAASKTATEITKLLETDSLGRWEEVGYGGQGVVEVVDGVLSLGAGDPITAVRWKGDLGDGPKSFPKTDYRVKYETRRTLGRDFFGTLTFPVGDDCCSLVLGGWGGGLTGLSSLNGDDAANNETTDFTAFENDQWYTVELTVTPEAIAASVDGKELFQPIAVPDYQIGIRIEMEPCKPLGIATFQSTGEIRNLTVERLSPAAKPAGGD